MGWGARAAERGVGSGSANIMEAALFDPRAAPSHEPGPCLATVSYMPTACSSSFVKAVTLRPATRYVPSSILMFMSALGPWHTCDGGAHTR